MVDREVRLIDVNKLERHLIEGDGHDDDRFTEGYNFAINEVRGCIKDMPTVEDRTVKRGHCIDYEKLIGIFGTLYDYMIDNGRCDVFCPYAETKDKDDECEAWRTIQKIRRED